MTEPPDFYDALALLRDNEIPQGQREDLVVRISEHTVKPIRCVTLIDLEVHADYLQTKREVQATREVEELNRLYYCDAVGEA